MEELRFDGRLKKAFAFSLFAILIFELILFRLSFARVQELGLAQCLWAFALSSLLPLGILLRLLFKVRPVLFARYCLYPEQLDIRSGRSSMIIKFEDVFRIDLNQGWTRFMKGFRLYHQSGQRVKVPSMLIDSQKILERIHEARPQLISENGLKSYLIQLQLVRVSWLRTVERLTSFKRQFLNLIIVPLVFALISWGMAERVDAMKFQILWVDWILFVFIIHLVVLLFVNSIEEKVVWFLYRIRTDGVDLKRLPGLESKVKIIFNLIYISLSLSGLVALLLWKLPQA